MNNRQKILDLYALGIPGPQIACKIGCSSSYVYTELHAAGVKPRNVGRAGVGGVKFSLTEQQREEVATAYLSGRSIRKIAAMLDRCEDTIVRALRKQNIPLRHNRGGAKRHFTEEQIFAIVTASRNGISQSAIARCFHTSTAIVNKLLLQLGEMPVRFKARGSDHGQWKGGRHITEHGYVLIKVQADSPFSSMRHSGGYVPEHRLVVAQHFGRPLEPYESVHHINGNRQDNRLENLQLRHGNHGNGSVHRCKDCGSFNIESVSLAEAPIVRRGMH